MIILSIDPGYDRLGIAILEKNNRGAKKHIYSDCFQTSRSDPFYTRVLQLGDEVNRVIKEYKPTSLAIETLFFNTNQKTAMKVAEARGVVVYEAIKAGLSIHEYTPPQIKTAITSDGRADKKQIIDLIPKLIRINKEIAFDDEYDAIATGLTHLAHSNNIKES